MSKKPRISYRDSARFTPTISQPAQPSVPEVVHPPQSGGAETPGAGQPAPDVVTPSLSFRDRVRARQGTCELLLFRVGREQFALELGRVEEAVDIPEVQELPEMSQAMLGVFTLRDALVALFACDPLLGVRSAAATTALVLQAHGRRVAVAIDDVNDVLILDMSELQETPVAAGNDGMVLGVLHRGRDLIALLDADVLVGACRGDAALETT